MGQDRAVGANSFARDLNTAACSRADLAVLLATLPEAQWQAAALAAGFAPRIETVRVAIPAHAEKQPQTDALVSAPSIQPELPPYQPSDLPDLIFWRIRAEQRDHTPPPDSETQIGLPLQALPLSDPACPPPQQQELLTPARQARLLRRQLAIPRPGAALDMGRLCQLLAERKLPAQLPRQQQPHWPGRLQVLLDVSLPLRPFWADFWNVAGHLHRLLGQRLVLWRTREGDPYHVEGQDERAGALPLNDGPVLLLSDGGLYSPDSGRARRWQEFGRLCAEQGKRPMLIAPVPERKVQPMYARLFELLLWDEGSSLQPFRLAHHGVSARAGQKEHPGSPHLLTALAHASRVEPHLLRAWRLALADCGTDIGSEYEVWHHTKVRANILACAVAKEYRAELAQQWTEWPQPRRHQLAELRYQSNRHLSPLIQAEEALAEGIFAVDEARAAAQLLAEQLHSTLRHGGPIPTGELAAYLLTMASRRPELLEASPKLAGAWAWLRRDDLANGALQNLPAGVAQEMLADALASKSQTAPYFLAQVGNQFGIYPAATSQPVCRLAELPKVPEYWQVECFQDDGSLGPARLLARHESFHPDPASTYRLRFGGDVLELEPVRRPEWAVGMGRDQDGLFAESKDGRRMYFPFNLTGNPFLFNCPATGARFVGREKLCHRFLGDLQQGVSISLVGEARMGKSSLLACWQELAQQAGRVTRLINGQGIAGGSYSAFVTTITGQETDPDWSIDQAASAIEAWIQSAPGGQVPLVLIDEAEPVLRMLPERFFGRLRDLITRQRLCLVLASRRDIGEMEYLNYKTSPLANCMKRLQLELLDEPGAQQLCALGAGVLSAADVQLIRQWAGRHPFYLSLLGHYLWQARRDGDSEAEALREFKINARVRLKEWWQVLFSKEQKQLAMVLDDNTPNPKSRLNERGLLDQGQPFGEVVRWWWGERA